MSSVNSHYPDYNVMDQADEWDEHTREIVSRRLGPFPEPEFLTGKEIEYLSMITKHLVYDNREEIISWIIHHFDQKMQSLIGEDQRKDTTPPEKYLFREGLKAIDHVAKLTYAKEFGELPVEKQFDILAALDKGQAAQIPEWSDTPQKELFKLLVGEITAAYYSHPTVWSDIGYGGPMYPRSYARIEFGLTDPWEAKNDER